MSKPSVAQILAAIVNRQEDKTLIIGLGEYVQVMDQYLTIETSVTNEQIRLKLVDEKTIRSMSVPVLQETVLQTDMTSAKLSPKDIN